MPFPLSIPSPPDEWRVFELGTWIHSLIPAFPTGGYWALPIHAYALCILAGIVGAILLANRRLTNRGGEPWVILDVAIWAVAFGIVGARLFHVITHPDDYFPIDDAHPLWRVFAVWEGGVAYYGALLGGALGVYIASRIAGLRFLSVLDALAPGMLIAQAFGRLGNWFNNELYGLPTDLPWGLEIDPQNPAYPVGLPDGTLFHPTFLYEIVWNIVGLVAILLLDQRVRLQWGKALAVYLIWQGVGRSFFESIRVDPSEYYLGVRANVWAAAAAIVLGIVILIVQTRRHPGLEPSVYRPGREFSPEAAVDSTDVYSDADDPDDAVESAPRTPATSGARAGS